ncbi:MAG TPA: hypothetical protein VGM90_14090 [Kofleriaceae bacterium]|jgi:hypothetical protein
MEKLLEDIRAAMVADAADDVRARGAFACRTILAALEARADEPMAATVVPPNPVASIVSVLQGVPAEQLLDMAITRLKAALPPGATTPPVAPVRFQMLSLPPTKGRQ